MPTSYTASITFQREAHRVRTVLTRVSSPEAVQAFINAIASLTTADIPKFSFTQSFETEITGSGLDISDVDFVCRIQMKNATTHAYAYFDLPAPAKTMFDLIEKTGYRLKASYGEAFAAAWSTLTGDSWTFEAGWIIG